MISVGSDLINYFHRCVKYKVRAFFFFFLIVDFLTSEKLTLLMTGALANQREVCNLFNQRVFFKNKFPELLLYNKYTFFKL